MTNFKNCIVRKNSKGEVVEVVELRTLTATQFKQLRDEAEKNTSKYLSEEHKLKEALEQEERIRNSKDRKHELLLAKMLFNDYVERGLLHTEECFEEMFMNWLTGKAPYDNSLEPTDFRKIKESVGK